MNLLQLFWKKEKYTSIIFNKDIVEILSLEIKKNNFDINHWNKDKIEIQDKDKISIVKELKNFKERNKIGEEKVFIVFLDHDLKIKILDKLKIAGFRNIKIIKNNIENDILKINFKNRKNTFIHFYRDESLEIIFSEKNNICEKIEYKNINEINWKKINKWIDEKIIYLSGYFQNKIQELEKIAFKEKIKIRILNFWKNINQEDNFIPQIKLEYSHHFFDSIDIILNQLKNAKKIRLEEITAFDCQKGGSEINFIIDNQSESEKEENSNEIKKRKEDLILEEKIIKKNNLCQKIKNWFKNIFIKKKKVEKAKKNQRKIFLPKVKKKIFLPKNKKQIFLPKPKKIKKEKQKKVIKKKKISIFQKALKWLKSIFIKEKKKEIKKEKIIFLPKPKKILKLKAPKRKKKKK